ncbi:uncharacterized protein LOC117650595 [Thrips palmi]|uniref:Uncharacterized protein LOC117650595 n=1 Tax=Thrips palmi TaxID=161013 RepID=A0A6P8ZY39_THRPL|nr:uncharacterized protein LOC117650595 [Thrips palmi]XP_034250030.1 uncharacterized protein LOC117650595 [Thrips palmi]
MAFRRGGGFLVLAALLAAAHARILDNEVLGEHTVDAEALSSRALPAPSWRAIVRCAVAAAPLDCVEARSQSAVDAMLAQMSEARAAADDTALEPEVVDKVAELSEVMVAAAASVLEQKLGIRDEDSQGLVEEGRGKKKKKKIHKLIALVKLVLLVLVVKLKLAFIMMALQTLFQFKLVVMVFLILLTKKISLWATLKASKNADAQKVVYYEHAQHQHHYDDHGGWGGGGGHDEHADAGAGGGSGWNLWGRSYETAKGVDGQGVGLDGQVPAGSLGSLGVQSGVYRAADGTRIVVRQPDAHDMAYSAQRP